MFDVVRRRKMKAVLVMHRIDYSVSGLLSFWLLQTNFVEQWAGQGSNKNCILELEVSSNPDPGSDNLQTDGKEV